MKVNENKKATLLQRLPVILAVTAQSYGLPLEASPGRKHGERRRQGPHAAKAGARSAHERS